MAVRLDRTHATGRIVLTCGFAIFGLFNASLAESWAQVWAGEPSASVLIDSAGPSSGVPVFNSETADGQNFSGGVNFAGDASGCCAACGGAGCEICAGAACDMGDCGPEQCRKACWIGRTDALILWRDAPPDQPLVDNGLATVEPLNANGMRSTAAAGPRVSIVRVNNTTGHAIEATYLRAANFRSIRPLSLAPASYALAPPGIYGNGPLTFDVGTANLGSRLQSFELNRYHSHGPCLRFLAGFRWIEWQEQFTLQGASLGGVTDFFQTGCTNDLYGGQIGLDANLFATSWIRFDGLVKAGAYYNNAVQSSVYTTNDPANPGTAAVTVGQSPLSGAFAGEVGLTGVVPLTRCLDLRFGYFGLWLSGIAQPTQQLDGQLLTPGLPAVGTLNANGGVLVQGVSLGLEGRW